MPASIATAGFLRNDDQGRWRRPATLGFVVLLHVMVLTLMLRDRGVVPAAAVAEALSVFDVPPPTLPPDPPIPPPPTPPRSSLPRARLALPPGGSAERAEPAPAPGTQGAAGTWDTTMAVEAPSSPPVRVGIGTAADLAGPGAAGTFDSSAGSRAGIGTGTGDDTGDGRGAGGGIAWRRAEWIVKPTPAEVSRVYPDAARRGRRAGIAYLACIVPRPGPATSCRPIYDRPRRLGFGQAAMRLWRRFRIKPVSSDRGDHPDIPVIVPVEFRHGQDRDRAKAAATSEGEAPPAPPQP